MKGPAARLSRMVAAVAFVTTLAIAVLAPKRHDYRHYLNHWSATLHSESPWVAAEGLPNAYGPAFVVFAPLAEAMWSVPRVLFVVAWWLSVFLIMRASNAPTWLGWLLGLHPLLWVWTAAYGGFESVVALGIVAAGVALRSGRQVVAGLALGFVALAKFYPLVLVPLWFFGRHGFRWRFLVATFSTVLTGFLLAWITWGGAVWAPFTMASARPSRLLSIFRALSGVGIDVDFLSVPLLVCALFALAVFHVRYRFSDWGVATLGLGTTMLLYKVGHIQFWMPPLFCACALLVSGDGVRHRQERAILWLGFSSAVWIGLYATMGSFQGTYAWMRDWMGFPAFVVHAVVLCEVFLSLDQRGRKPSKISVSSAGASM